MWDWRDWGRTSSIPGNMRRVKMQGHSCTDHTICTTRFECITVPIIHSTNRSLYTTTCVWPHPHSHHAHATFYLTTGKILTQDKWESQEHVHTAVSSAGTFHWSITILETWTIHTWLLLTTEADMGTQATHQKVKPSNPTATTTVPWILLGANTKWRVQACCSWQSGHSVPVIENAGCRRKPWLNYTQSSREDVHIYYTSSLACTGKYST